MKLSDTFELKSGTNIPHTVLSLKRLDIIGFKKLYNEKTQQAPKLFLNALIVIDLQNIKHNITKNTLLDIKITIENSGASILGIKNASKQQAMTADELGISLVHNHTSKIEKNNTDLSNVMIHNKIRSGMQIYAKNKDLVVMGDVNHGGEVIADGNIYVYGALNGKAIAGANQNKEANIFSLSLNPELISIAGIFMLNEAISSNYHSKKTRIKLNNNKLEFNIISEKVLI